MGLSLRSAIVLFCSLALLTPQLMATESKKDLHAGLAIPKYGVLDSQRLVSAAPQAKEAAKRLEAEFQGAAQKLTEKQNDFQSKRGKFQRDRDILSAAERSKKEKELLKLEQDIRRMDEELRAETAARNREEMDDFLRVVRDVVEKFGQEQNYDAIFSQEVIVYSADRMDITDQILDKLQKLPKSAEKKSEK